MPDDLAALRLQIEWGADEAIAADPPNRFSRDAGAPAPRRPLPHAVTAGATMGADEPPLPVPARARALAAAAADPAGLAAALSAFDGCALRHTAGAFAFADGPADAPLVLVVEAPDTADDETGRPLSGPDGRFLDGMLAAAGISRAACRVVTVVPWRPPGGRPPNAVEIGACAPFLLRHLELLPFNHAVLFGASVARLLLGVTGTARALRGTWHELAVPGRAALAQALIMLPPAQMAADARTKKNSWGDTLMLREKCGPLSAPHP